MSHPWRKKEKTQDPGRVFLKSRSNYKVYADFEPETERVRRVL